MTSLAKRLQQNKAAISSSSSPSSSSSSSSSIKELENLFISKFTEKYNLTERDISRAFKKYDKDGSGTLNIIELQKAIHMFLNGVSLEQIKLLVSYYDIDGDGQISIDEFTQFLLSRSTPNQDDWLTVDNLIAKKNNNNNNDNNNINDNVFDCVSEISRLTYDDNNNPNIIETKAKTYLQNLKATLLKKSMEMRLQGKVPLVERLSNHLNPLAESLARQMIAKAFQPYCRKGTRVDFTSFCRVLCKFNSPGQAPLKEEVHKFLYGMCDGTIDGQLADPDILIDIVFDKSGHVINKFGFIQPVKAITFSGRPETGPGPIVRKPGDVALKLSDVPMSFVTKTCKTAITAPSNFDVRMINNSSQNPPFSGDVEHVYGLSIDLYSGAAIHSLSCSPDPRHKDLIVYTSAALGIVHDLRDNYQIPFKGHHDNITCVCICSDGSLVATGQMGKSSYVCIWAPDSFRNPTQDDVPGTINNDERVPGLLAVIGKGFFKRGVCAIGFNQDGRYLAAVGCDDKHEMGIWKVQTGELLTSMSCTNGVPPQIKDLCWAPSLQTTEWISKDHEDSINELMCTVGERHIKFWSFKPAGKGNYNASLVGKLFRMGNSGFDSPKIAYCVAFVPSNGDRYDVVSGADTGHIHRWKEGVCVGAVIAIPGGVLTLKVSGSLLFCGGARGIVKMINSNDLSIIQSFSVLPTTDSISDRPPSSARSGARSRPGTASNVPVAGAASKQGSGNVAKKLIKQTKQYQGPLIGDAKEEQVPDGVKGSANVTSIALEFNGPNVTSVLATTGFGRLIRINIMKASTDTLFYYHYGPLYGLAIDKSTAGAFFASGGDDKWLNVWDHNRKSLICRARTRAPIRCIDFNVTGDSIAVGHASGIFVVYALLKDRQGRVGGTFERLEGIIDYKLQELVKRKDCVEDISDIKFCPNGKMLAVGNHDNFIDIYQYKLIESSLENGFSIERQISGELRYLKRLKGHSSYITHLDWSADNRLLQSTCGAYELLYWDVLSGRQLLNSKDNTEADTAWYTNTCVLGFGTMGIWAPSSNGTDVNAVDVSKRNGIIISGDDFNGVNVFNYPCIVKNAPGLSLKGHASHVLNVKIIPSSSSNKRQSDVRILSVGGESSLIQWHLQSI